MPRIAVTGGTGFVGRHLVAQLRDDGHDVVALSRDSNPETAFVDCDAVVHCAGINRELGSQTFRAAHVQYTERVIAAARSADVHRITMVSFLRARADCGSPYHETKWAAEELIRASGLDWTVIKAGVIYGRGDHLIDHVSRAIRTVPIFGLVGLRGRPLRPVAVADVVRVLAAAALGDLRLSRRTMAVVGPEELTLGEVGRRVARVVGRRTVFVPMPVRLVTVLAVISELVMKVPLVARAQVRILAEGVTEALPRADELPSDLRPNTRFEASVIQAGMASSRGFGRDDVRICRP